MVLKITYNLLIDNIRAGSINLQDAQRILNDLSPDLTDDQIEEAENLIHEEEQKSILEEVSFYDAIPHDAEWRDDWWSDDDGGWDE
jgi:hypothetical protein